jgi:hypothetical protein
MVTPTITLAAPALVWPAYSGAMSPSPMVA